MPDESPANCKRLISLPLLLSLFGGAPRRATGVGFELVRGLDSQRVVGNNIHHRFLIEEVGSPIRQIWKGGTNNEQHSDFCRLKDWG